eukprot:6209863-Pleurochrysis_carterae.AAC.5
MNISSRTPPLKINERKLHLTALRTTVVDEAEPLEVAIGVGSRRPDVDLGRFAHLAADHPHLIRVHVQRADVVIVRVEEALRVRLAVIDDAQRRGVVDNAAVGVVEEVAPCLAAAVAKHEAAAESIARRGECREVVRDARVIGPNVVARRESKALEGRVADRVVVWVAVE